MEADLAAPTVQHKKSNQIQTNSSFLLGLVNFDRSGVSAPFKTLKQLFPKQHEKTEEKMQKNMRKYQKTFSLECAINQ